MRHRRWRRPSWLAIALTLGGAALFARLGVWQLDRGAQAQTLLDAFDAAPAAAYEDFATLAQTPPPDRFPHVRVHGRFVANRGYVRDEQMRNGRLGVEAYAIFDADGSAATLLVDRGWIAWQHEPGSTAAVPTLPLGEVDIAGIYAPFPGSGLRAGGNRLATQNAWPKLTLAIDHDEIAADLARPLLPRVLLLDADPASGFARAWTPALMPPARHVAYAFQWFALALAVLAAFFVVHWKKIDK